MALRSNCRGCRHCQPPGDAALGWCRLRQLPIHPDLASDLWCHHWTARAPRLPTFTAHAAQPLVPRLVGVSGFRQLSLDMASQA